MKPGVDVVVVNYRTPADLLDFVWSFNRVQFEVPASLHIVEVDPLIKVDYLLDAMDAIQVPTSLSVFADNVGYAQACNSAAESCERATLAFFNADTRLASGVLDGCHDYLHANDDVGVVGPRQVNNEGLITHAGIFGSNQHPSFGGRWKDRDRGQYSKTEECVSVSGSAYFVKRTCWDQLKVCPQFVEVAPGAKGAFLPTRHFYEELYVSLHARRHGWKVVYLGQFAMVHKWHQASPVGGEFARRVLPESLEYFRRACDAHGIERE